MTVDLYSSFDEIFFELVNRDYEVILTGKKFPTFKVWVVHVLDPNLGEVFTATHHDRSSLLSELKEYLKALDFIGE
jgi:hypothetical protein